MTSASDAVDVVTTANRILVVGPSGSGKTYLSLRLGAALNCAPIHLDARFWRPGWVNTQQSEWRVVVQSLIQAERWIMDGTYESTLDLRVPAAEAIIVIEGSRWRCLWRVLRRAMIHRGGPRPDAPPRQPIDIPFLRYIWRYNTETRQRVNALIEKHGADKRVVVLNGPKDINGLIAEMDARGMRARGEQTRHRQNIL